MKVFISWAGELSNKVALELSEWLRSVIQSVEPFMSTEAVDAGTRWSNGIAQALENATFGVAVVTRENLEAPWLHFEAGAIAKSVTDSRVIPLLLDVTVTDIKGPLAQFQAQPLNEEGMFKVVSSINSVLPQPLKDARLRTSFDKYWPDLSIRVTTLRSAHVAPQLVKRPERDILEEVLETVRRIDRRPIVKPLKTVGRRPVMAAQSRGGQATIDAFPLWYVKGIEQSDILELSRFGIRHVHDIINSHEIELRSVSPNLSQTAKKSLEIIRTSAAAGALTIPVADTFDGLSDNESGDVPPR